MRLTDKQSTIWKQARPCRCGVVQQDRSGDHKLCAICNETMSYGAHQSVESQRNSFNAWNVDHRIPKSNDGSDDMSNLQAVHTYCNQNKADQ